MVTQYRYKRHIHHSHDGTQSGASPKYLSGQPAPVHLDAVSDDTVPSSLFKAPCGVVMRRVQLNVVSESLHGLGDVHNQSFCAPDPQIWVDDNYPQFIFADHIHLVAV